MKISLNRVLLFFIIFNSIKSETWFNEVTGHDINDPNNGYAGGKGKAITAFYLNGNRHYRVHYLGNEKYSWTGEYWGSGVVGIGRSIDAISISGGYNYRVRYKNGNWEKPVNGFSIYDGVNGYAGTIGKEIDAILIEGDEGYRVAYGGESSNVEEVSKRVVKNLFGIDFSYSFDYEMILKEDNAIKVTIKLDYEYKYTSQHYVSMIIKNNKAVDVRFGDFGNIIDELKKVINFDINKLRTKIEHSYSKGMANGSVNVVFYWAQRKIEISAGSKITPDHNSYRGGFTITIYLKDDMNMFTEKMLAPCTVFLKRLGINGEVIIATIRRITGDIIKMIIEVINGLRRHFQSFIPTFLSFVVCFVLSFVFRVPIK